MEGGVIHPHLTAEERRCRDGEVAQGCGRSPGVRSQLCVTPLPPDCFCKTPSNALEVVVHFPETQMTVIRKAKWLILSWDSVPAVHSQPVNAPCPCHVPSAVCVLVHVPSGRQVPPSSSSLSSWPHHRRCLEIKEWRLQAKQPLATTPESGKQRSCDSNHTSGTSVSPQCRPALTAHVGSLLGS